MTSCSDNQYTTAPLNDDHNSINKSGNRDHPQQLLLMYNLLIQC